MRPTPRTTVPAALPPAMRGMQPTATVPVSRTECPAAMDPNAYALVVDGDCLAPIVFSGDLVLVSPAAPLTVGEFVVLHPHQGRPLLKRLVCPPPPFGIAPGSDIEGLVIVEQLNPQRRYFVPTRMLHSVHAVVGVMPRARHEAVRVPIPAAAAGAGGPIPGALARRGLLGVAAALAVPVAAEASRHRGVLPLQGENPDAELIEACAEYSRLELSERELMEAADTDEEIDAIADEFRPLFAAALNRLTEMRATTPEGILARVQVLEVVNGVDGPHSFEAGAPAALLHLILRDGAALRTAGRA